MRKKVAILGASYLQLPLVLKAKELGIETHCFAWDNAEAVCKNKADFFYDISVLEKDRILAKCKEVEVNGITTIATDVCIPVVCYVAEQMGLISNTVGSGFISTNKYAMRERFKHSMINSPNFKVVAEFDATMFEKLSFPLIVKPTDRSGSRGVTKVLHKDQLEKAIQIALSESLEHMAIVEEFIEGLEVSVECISWEGKHFLLAITDKITTGEPYFVELQHHQPSLQPASIISKIAAETFKALDALDIKFGASHSEFKITESGEVIVIEIGARMGGDFIGSHLVELSTGYDFLKGVLEVALNQFSEPKIKQGRYAGVYFLSKDSEYLLPYFARPNSFEVEKQILKSELNYIRSSNDRSGYLIYADDNKIIIS